MSDAFSKGISGRAVALGLLCCLQIAFDEPSRSCVMTIVACAVSPLGILPSNPCR